MQPFFSVNQPVRFCLWFLASLAMLATLLELFPAPFGYLHLSPVAWIATVILKTIGVPAELTTRDAAAGYCLLDLDGVHYLVTHECTGIVAAFIVTAAIIAYPTARTQKHRGLALAIPAVTLFGVLRLVVLGVVAQSRPEWIDVFHVYIMELATLAFAIFVFVYWIEEFARR